MIEYLKSFRIKYHDAFIQASHSTPLFENIQTEKQVNTMIACDKFVGLYCWGNELYNPACMQEVQGV